MKRSTLIWIIVAVLIVAALLYFWNNRSKVANQVEGAKDQISQTVSDVESTLDKAGDSAKEAVTDAASSVQSTLDQAGSTIEGAASDVKDALEISK